MAKRQTRPRGYLTGALALDRDSYRAIAESPRATPVALLIVIVATALCGAGGLLWTQWGGRVPDNFVFTADPERFLMRSVLIGGGLQIAMWAAMVAVTLIYLRAFGETVRLAPLARTMGFAFAPMGIQVLICPPGMEFAAAAVAVGYTFAAMITAVQAAASTTPGRAVVSVIAGFALFAVTLSLLGNGTTDLAPGIFSLDPLPNSISLRPLR